MRLILLLLTFCTLSLYGEVDIYERKNISIDETEEFEGTYFEVGEFIDISGKIKGNAFLIGTQIVIDGEIEGNLIAIAGSVEIKGKVLGSVRLLAGQATIGGTIEKGVNLVSANLIMPPEGKIKGGVFAVGGYGEISNVIGGNMVAIIGGLKIAGTLKKNLKTFVGRLRIAKTADIQGKLRYRSAEESTIEPGAKIAGGVTYTPTLLSNIMDSPLLSSLAIGSKIATFLMNFLYTFGMGALFIRFFPRKIEATLAVLENHPMQSVLCGLSIVVLLPVVSIILLITIVGTPFALTLMALNIVSFYTVKIFSILWISNEVFGRMGFKKNRFPILFTGQIAYYLLCLIPLGGWFVSLFFMLFGLGASVLSWTKHGQTT
jgi:cytoskeletal protein CcmA (bactofilin family)